MKVTPREKKIIDRFNGSLVELEPNNHGKRPADSDLAKMSDAEVLAGDWLVDIEDSTFWNRWDEANANLTIDNGVKYWTNGKIHDAVREGKACYWPQSKAREMFNQFEDWRIEKLTRGNKYFDSKGKLRAVKN